MDDESKNHGGWKSVPAFGEWDYQKDGAVPDYSLDFSKIREMRKQNKKDFSRSSIGNDEELIQKNNRHDDHHGGDGEIDAGSRPHHHRGQSPTRRKKIMSYFNCCIIGS